MAGNKVNAKAKGKDDKGKGKSLISTNDEGEEPDFSLLRKPIHTSITGFGQARKIFDLATEELKNLLSDECDLLYECKVCRNIFRSLANFISHKRVYCKEKFNSTVHGHFIKSASTLNELIKIKRTEEGYQEFLKSQEPNETESMDTDEVDERVPLTKDLTAIVEKLAQKKGSMEYNDETQVSLQKIPNSAVAVFQSIETGEERNNENMRAEVNEIDNILSRDMAVLQSDGNFKVQSSTSTEKDNVIQIISDDEENGDTDDLKCKICEMQFSTQKTLRFHMKYKHVESRLVYPCPDCMEIFSTSWSVYRHLFKVHRKTAAQIRRLRESIQAKAFKMNNPPAFYEKRKNNMKTVSVQKITEEERLDQENQAWMDNMEGDGEVPRCGGCGRTFERRAALAAHTHTCQPRSRALARRPMETKRIEIQIRKDYNKGPTNLLPLKTSDSKTTDTIINENKTAKEEDVPKATTKKEPDPIPEDDNKSVDENSMDSISRQSGDDQTSNDATESPEKNKDKDKDEDKDKAKPLPEPVQSIRLPFAQHVEKSNLMALRQRILPDIELVKLLCKKCDTQYTHIQDLYDHVATHYKWMRYACKLCNFKHYHFDKLPEHVKVVHKLKGDKDFYFSTVKAIDGPEALELAEEEVNDEKEARSSPGSRRPSRCSSDSSRLSDDSSSSSTRVEGARKRKVHKVQSKGIGKRMKSSLIKDKKDDDDSSNVKGLEENSSDIEEAYERAEKKPVDDTSSVASRRPVRRKAKPKNEDFEYDLSNLLKMEAQGYRDSQTATVATTKSSQTKKKTQDNQIPTNYEIFNKECCGALVSMSRKSVENAKAHMKTAVFSSYTPKEKVPSNVFARPMLPKGLTRLDKISPKKEIIEEDSSPVKPNLEDSSKVAEKDNIEDYISNNVELNDTATTTTQIDTTNENDSKKSTSEVVKTNHLNIPAVVPIKFRRQSLDVMKNPIINKNISDFTKAGMKTKILVIKPINRGKGGTQSSNTPLKFQTIKLKEAKSSSEDKLDQVVVVKVPKVDRIQRTLPETTTLTKLTDDNTSVINENASDTDKASKSEAEVNSNPPKNEISKPDTNGDVENLKPETLNEWESHKNVNEINFKSTDECDNDRSKGLKEAVMAIILGDTTENESNNETENVKTVEDSTMDYE